MKPGAGKAKGSKFERDIAKQLSLWWTSGKREDVYGRSVTSGAWKTQRAKQGKDTFGQAGDLQALDPIGQPLVDVCCFEFKIGYDGWCFLDEVDKREGTKDKTFFVFWKQAEEQADNRWPVVIAKRDRRQPVIIFPKEMFTHLQDKRERPRTLAGPVITICRGDVKVACVLLDSFLAWCSPRYFQ